MLHLALNCPIEQDLQVLEKINLRMVLDSIFPPDRRIEPAEIDREGEVLKGILQGI